MALPSSETYGEIDACWGTTRRMGCRSPGFSPRRSEGAEYGVSGDRQRQRNCHPVNKIVRSYIPDLFNYDDITRCITVCRRWHRDWRKI